MEELANILIMERIQIRELPAMEQPKALKRWKMKLDNYEERNKANPLCQSSFEIRRVK